MQHSMEWCGFSQLVALWRHGGMDGIAAESSEMRKQAGCSARAGSLDLDKTKSDVHEVSTQLCFNRTRANEAGPYSIPKWQYLWKARNNTLAYKWVKKGRRGRKIRTCFWGIVRLLGASVQRLAFLDK